MPSYMINGFEIECREPSPWELRLTWSHGKVSIWPAETRGEALAEQSKISLRPTLMSRIAVHGPDGSEEVLYDSSWPRESYGDLMGLPDAISVEFVDVLLNAIDREKDRAAGVCM